ncbi:MAG: hypothetical protein CMH55_09530 [Myxococcales bacterium]|nr:hypothetical protein [Myxococcales bacterium]
MLLNLLLIVAAIPGATNPRTLVLGPKVNSASEDVRLSAVAKLAEALEDSKLMTRRLSNGNLIDFKGKELLRTPIAVMLRSLLQAGCEQEICAKELRKAFSRLGAVARVTIEPLNKDKGALVTVWVRGISRDGAYGQRIERRAVIEKVDPETVGNVVAQLGKGISDYRPAPISDPPTLVRPPAKKPQEQAVVTLTDLAPWKVIADQRAKQLAAALDAQRKEREAKAAAIQAEREAELQKIRDARNAEETERAAKAKAEMDARNASRAAALKKWQSRNVGGEFMLRGGASRVEGGGVTPSLAGNLRLPVGEGGLRLALGVEVGTMPLEAVMNEQSEKLESWLQLTPSMEPEGCAGKSIQNCQHQFWYLLSYHRFVNFLSGRLDIPVVMGNGGLGFYLGGDLGLAITHGSILQLQMQVNESGDVLERTGQEVRTTNESFTWAGLQYGGQVGVWAQMPNIPITLSVGYRVTRVGLNGVETMRGPIFENPAVDPTFAGSFDRQQFMVDLGYRF